MIRRITNARFKKPLTRELTALRNFIDSRALRTQRSLFEITNPKPLTFTCYDTRKIERYEAASCGAEEVSLTSLTVNIK